MKIRTLIQALENYAAQYNDQMDVAIDFVAGDKYYRGPICTVAVSMDVQLRLVSHHTHRHPRMDAIARRIAETKESKVCIVPSHMPPKIELIKE